MADEYSEITFTGATAADIQLIQDEVAGLSRTVGSGRKPTAVSVSRVHVSGTTVHVAIGGPNTNGLLNAMRGRLISQLSGSAQAVRSRTKANSLVISKEDRKPQRGGGSKSRGR